MKPPSGMVDASASIALPFPSLSLDLVGYPITISVPDGVAGSMVARVFRDFDSLPAAGAASASAYRLTRADHTAWEVSAAGSVRYRSPHLMDAVVALEWVIVSAMIDARRDLVHLHAAALMAPARDAAILIAGESGSGKTTLTLGLMARGFLPYSDDVTLLTPASANPLPFRRAFHIDARAQSLLRNLPPPPTWDSSAAPDGYFLIPCWADTPCPIRTVLFPTLAPGAEPDLAPLSMADATARLLPFSATLAHSPALALHTAARVVQQARCYALTAGVFATTLDRIIAQLQWDRTADRP